MVGPAAKGIIIAGSILVAAGIALYENPQVREWIDNHRRKLAVALHSLGDEVNPPSRSRRNSDEDGHLSYEQRRRRREELARRNRNELVRRAREEGVAVDLDELAAIGREQQRDRPPNNASFDTLVNHDGSLRDSATATSSAMPQQKDVRKRRTTSSQGFQSGANYANPFADEAGIVLFDHDHQQETGIVQDGPSVHEDARQSRESTATLPAETPLIDTTPDPEISVPDLQTPSMDITQPPQQPIDLLSNDASFYSAGSDHAFVEAAPNHMDDDTFISPGARTPTEAGFSTSASVAGTNDDLAVLSSIHGSAVGEDDPFSHADTASDAGFTDHSFSEVGISTPGSWTDVGSDDESDIEPRQRT